MIQPIPAKKVEDSEFSAVNVRMEVEGTPLEAPFTEEEIDLLNCKVTALNLNFYPLDKFRSLPLSFTRQVIFYLIHTQRNTTSCKIWNKPNKLIYN